MRFYRDNKVFSCLYFLAVMVTLFLVCKLGFAEAAQQIAGQPERLRDITFNIWESYPVMEHGYLVFYSLEDFRKGVAYSNHATVYLFYMYALYKIEMLLPFLQMRMVGAFLNIISLAVAVFYILSRITIKRVALMNGALAILAVVFMVSMPGFWISAARFNVDNTFPLIFTILVLISFFIWEDNWSGKRVWLSVLLFAIFSPTSAVLLGLALVLYSFRYESLDMKLLKLAIAAMLLGCIFYLQPIMVSKIIGFTSSNSGWLFRAGLDGDTTYFSNALLSVISPQLQRPLHIIAIPILLLLVQMAYLRKITAIDKSGSGKRKDGSVHSSIGVFYYLIFSLYLLNWLLWPQAIAIHPYLYDYLFLAPASVLIILNFLNFPDRPNYSRLWILVLLFLISFNFQLIAQAKCLGCIYPAFGANT